MESLAYLSRDVPGLIWLPVWLSDLAPSLVVMLSWITTSLASVVDTVTHQGSALALPFSADRAGRK